MSFISQLRHAWNAFINRDDNARVVSYGEGATYGARPDRVRLRWSNERSILASIYNRIGMDVASIDIRHVRLDDAGRYASDVDSGLNTCLTLEANLDQGATAFRQDLAMSLFDDGCIAVIPVDTTLNPALGSFDIKTMRVGRIVGWSPSQVRVMAYNQLSGIREEITMDKKNVAIIENPLYSVMNEPNSTLQRLIRKLNLLDAIDEQSGSGKLDLIIQLPYVIKSDARRQQAEQRRKDVEAQLKGSQYGIAYTDGTEKVTQLNRPAENNLLKQVEYLTAMVYSELGLTVEIMNGTADEKTMLNYYNRTVNPIVKAIVEAMKRSFLTKTARTQNQSIMAFRNPFDLVPITDMAEIADKFTRNEILSANEIRAGMGIAPSQDPKADELRNSNMPDPNQQSSAPASQDQIQQDSSGLDDVVNGLFDGLTSDIDSILSGSQ